MLAGTPVRSSLTPQPLPDWVPSGRAALVVCGRQSRRRWPQQGGAAVPTLRNGCRVVHLTGDNDPDIQHLAFPLLVERHFSDDPGCYNMPTASAAQGRPSELAVAAPQPCWCHPQAADQHQSHHCAMHLVQRDVHQHEPDQPVLLTTVQRLDSTAPAAARSWPRCVTCGPGEGCRTGGAERWWRNQAGLPELHTQRPHDATVVAARP